MLNELYESLREIYKSYFTEKENIREKLEGRKIQYDYQFYIDYIGLLDLRINTLSGVLKVFENFFLSEENSDSFGKLNNLGKIKEKEVINQRLQILDIQEKERQRIARDLHDSSLQNLSHLLHNVELSALYVDEDPVKAKLELAVVNSRLKSIIQEIRDTIFDLRPMTFDDLGLKEAFERLVYKLRESSKFNITYNIEDIGCNNSLILMTIFRIIEECLNNAIKHSRGSKINFELKKNTDDDCLIIVSDNGISFNFDDVLLSEDRHFGLCILRERVELLSGTMEIDSKPEHGTIIKIIVPLLE
ncbi:signal transduction histidine-protein kinase/phosphatase DegS [Lachnospiraceae bacterium]|jgi:two-component system sensor histidine kinase DegS|nr:sensor histidine kinase [Lachnospiraceae bacterium]MCI9106840.1 sensor histidine kinase [Lachnospiraceae bacterium]GFH89575.1 signal transduction histidine-protein kinase/phosphatase DegS [Lachnospiraceae bacterium]